MREHLTELVFILDRSGSMRGLESDTIGGFNSMIDKQRELPGEVRVSTVLFNNKFRVLHNRKYIKNVSAMTQSQFSVSGTTALLDAVGRAVRKIKHIFCDTLKENRPTK